MKYGCYIFATDYSVRPDELARVLEDRGFESFWVPEHTHIPAGRQSPWPGGAPLPREYWHTLDPFVALGAAAAVTSRIKLGTGICLVIERDPITLAKEVASLDWLSRGRVLFGVGGGWNAEEMGHHGTDFASRWTVLRERIAAMKAIWERDEAEYHGKYVNFDRLWSYPKPVQKPHPPILMGGTGPHARQRAAEFDGHWMPISSRDPIDEGLADLRARAAKLGRDPATVTVSLFGAKPDEAKLATWRDQGVERAIFTLPSAGRDTVLPLVDRYASFVTSVG
jgi:probable F420-dependent oxidoreductase